MTVQSADAELFAWWVSQGDCLTLDEARPRYAEWLEDAEESLRDFWGDAAYDYIHGRKRA